jgi:SdrD B-like protein
VSRPHTRRLAIAASLSAFALLLGSAPALADPTDDIAPPVTETTTTTRDAPAPSTTENPTPATPAQRPVVKAAPAVKAAPQIELDVAFGKSSYSVAELVTLNLTVHNTGDAVAKNVIVFADDSVRLEGTGFGPVSQAGLDIAPGESVTATAHGYIVSVGDGQLTYHLDAVWDDSTDVATADATTTVTPASGDYSGVIYIDENDNGAFDDGEGFGGVAVLAHGGAPQLDHETTTADDGSFSFEDLPGGWYSVGFEAPGGWNIPGPENHGEDEIVVGGTEQTTGLEYPAARPLKETLHLKMAFDKKSYHVGDAATLLLTLSNSGTKRITGITANCNRSGQVSKSWDGIAPPGDLGGRTWALDPGASVRIQVPGKVLPGALEFGKIAVGCDFGNSGWLVDDNPAASASAKVVKAGAAGGGSGDSDTPAAQGSAGPDGLAYTGVNVFNPLLGGLVLLAAGAALVVATRRRLA